MSQIVNLKQVHIAMGEVRAEMNRDVDMGIVRRNVNGLIPTVFVGQVSARKWMVGWNFQPKNIENGKMVMMPHQEEFIGVCVACK